MYRFMTFANGSNLFTAFKHLDLYVDDYESLYRYVFNQTVERWKSTFAGSAAPVSQLVRVYWHVVDSMDEWDLGNPRTRQHLVERFLDDREVRNRWMNEASRVLAGTGEDRKNVEQIAFEQCYDDLKTWYGKKQQILGGMNRFYHAVEASSDFIEICHCGRWKVDLLRKSVQEKGLDVCFAVDMVGLMQNYDVAIIVGGDTDGIPSLEYVKSRGKQVAVVEFIKGGPSDGKVKTFASPLRLAADLVVPIYEKELVRLNLAEKGEDEFEIGENA